RSRSARLFPRLRRSRDLHRHDANHPDRSTHRCASRPFAERAVVAPRLHHTAVRHRRRSRPQAGELISAHSSFADGTGPKIATLGTNVLATEKMHVDRIHSI